MGRGGEHIRHGVLLPGGDAAAALSPPGLARVFTDRGALQIARLRQGKDTLFLLYEVLNVQLVLHFLDLRQPFVSEASGDLDQFLPENGFHQGFVPQNPVVIGDFFLKLFIFCL